MKIKDYIKTWEFTRKEIRFNRLLQILLFSSIVLLSLNIYNSKPIVVITPYTLTAEASVTKDDSSVGYKEAWGYAMSQLLGNVTPLNVNFIKDRLVPLLGTGVYKEVIKAVELQVAQIKEDNITTRFEPKYSEYEPSTNKIFITGTSYISGTIDKSTSELRTYEFRIDIGNYLPVFTYFNTYKGNPKLQPKK